MDTEKPTRMDALEETQIVAALEHLTGPNRHHVTWLWQSSVNLWLSPKGHIHLFAAEADQSMGTPLASLRRAEDSYVIEAFEGQSIWVNGHRVSSRLLKNLDTIEFGDNGPITRCHLYGHNQKMRGSVGDILGDTAAYFRSSRRSVPRRFAASVALATRRLTMETTILFRVGVVAALIILAGLVYQQSRMDLLLRQQIESGTAEIEGFARTLAHSREDALTVKDLDVLSKTLQGQLLSTTERLAQIEHRSGASARVIAQSTSAILFLQGAYGFREKADGRMLRHAIGDDGKSLVLPNGLPLLSLEGEGPVAEREFTGTGFMLGDGGILVTNRHLGLPWENDSNVKTLAAQGLEPVMTKFLGYLPGAADGLDVEFVKASEQADVAILRLAAPVAKIKGLQLAQKPPSPGDEVIVMGYPTGLRSMLAQAGEAFVEDLQQTQDTNFWSVAGRLAAAGRIIPLASRGIVGRASDETIVYDAETARGGSGGPVLDIHGDVVAVNAAILPEYGGSNLGVPAQEVRNLLADPMSN